MREREREGERETDRQTENNAVVEVGGAVDVVDLFGEGLKIGFAKRLFENEGGRGKQRDTGEDALRNQITITGLSQLTNT